MTDNYTPVFRPLTDLDKLQIDYDEGKKHGRAAAMREYEKRLDDLDQENRSLRAFIIDELVKDMMQPKKKRKKAAAFLGLEQP